MRGQIANQVAGAPAFVSSTVLHLSFRIDHLPSNAKQQLQSNFTSCRYTRARHSVPHLKTSSGIQRTASNMFTIQSPISGMSITFWASVGLLLSIISYLSISSSKQTVSSRKSQKAKTMKEMYDTMEKEDASRASLREVCHSMVMNKCY
jgi:hypothetical protein